MKILQLNIWGGKLDKNLIDLLRREEADVLCLQEVVHLPGSHSVFFADLEEIQQSAGYDYVHFTPSYECNFMHRTMSWGNAVLSRQPFVETKKLYTYLEKVENFDRTIHTDYNAGRVLQHVVIKTEKTPLHVLNHHGYHINSHKNGDNETIRQCGMIADYVKKLEGLVVLCGDFNLVGNCQSIEQINSVLINHVNKNNVTSTRTPLTHKSEACDFIFTSPEIEVQNFQVLDDIASDHKALVVEF